MTLPAGVLRVYVHFGPFMDDSGVPYGGQVTFEGSAAKVHAASGTPVIPRGMVAVLDESGVGNITLAATDQPGFVDGDGNQVIDWTYTVTVSLKGRGAYTRIISLPSLGVDMMSVDLDLMIDQEPSPGTIVALPEVLSVNGMTGAVVINPGSVELSTDIGNIAIFGVDGKLYVGHDAQKADVTSLATVATSGLFSDLSGFVPTAALPPLAINDVTVVADQTAMLALAAQRGDMAIRTDDGRTYVLATDDPTTLADWKQISAAGSVVSVNGQTGTVIIGIAHISGLQTALDGKADNVHDHLASGISNSTTVGRALMTALDEAAARGAIGAGTSSLALGTGAADATPGNAAVRLTGDQSVAGIKTFTAIPVLPASDPTSGNQAARKQYVDDAVAGVSGGGTARTWVKARATSSQTFVTDLSGVKVALGAVDSDFAGSDFSVTSGVVTCNFNGWVDLHGYVNVTTAVWGGDRGVAIAEMAGAAPADLDRWKAKTEVVDNNSTTRDTGAWHCYNRIPVTTGMKLYLLTWQHARAGTGTKTIVIGEVAHDTEPNGEPYPFMVVERVA